MLNYENNYFYSIFRFLNTFVRLLNSWLFYTFIRKKLCFGVKTSMKSSGNSVETPLVAALCFIVS